MKSVVTLCVVIPAFALTAWAGSPTRFHCDFNNGIPEDVMLVDNDGNKPSADVSSFGFEIGRPWVAVRVDDSHLLAAASTSWYSTPSASDDWMILPKVRIASADVSLSWESRAHDSVLSDGYCIYVSDSGDGIDDFKKNAPVFSCPAENVKWTEHSICLADYVGKDVNIAFVNNSTDKALLYIDNVVVEEQRALSCTRLVPPLLAAGDNLTLHGTVTNRAGAEVKGLSVKITIDGREYTLQDVDRIIPDGQSTDVDLATDFVSDAMASHPYDVSVSLGDCSLTQEGTLLSVRQNVLMEEGTGTWCMWCPRGAVAIETLKQKYPETFMPVAVHVNDPMAVEGYSVYTQSGYPVCVANRIDKLRGNPSEMESFYLDAAGRDPIVAVVAAGQYDASGNVISLSSDVTFSKDYQDAVYTMQYIVVENNVHGEGSGYNQRNAYSGGSDVMGGYENLPDPVPASSMWYQEVARLRSGHDSGINGSLPSYIKGGELLHHDYELNLGDNIMNPDEIKVIAAVVDTKSGEIVNSAYVPVSGISSVTGIGLTAKVRLVRNGGMLYVVSDMDTEEISALSIDGAVMKSVNGGELDVSGLHGICIVRVKANGEFRYFKQAL